MTRLFNRIWQEEKIHDQWKKGLIVKIAKRGDLKECKNWPGVTLLSVASKVMGSVIIERIQNDLDRVLRKEQAGFRKNKSTIGQIFILRNIIEQVNEWQATFYAHFVDFEKAFDSVHHKGLGRIMKAYSIPDKLIRMVKILSVLYWKRENKQDGLRSALALNKDVSCKASFSCLLLTGVDNAKNNRKA